MRHFDHEKLNVYQAAIQFVVWSSELLTQVPKTAAIHNQLDRASTSIPLNIAEGNGKHTPADRCRFFDTARGSALESAACLDVLVAKSLMQSSQISPGKKDPTGDCRDAGRSDSLQFTNPRRLTWRISPS